MLKHEKIIKRMSLKDKITFLFSNTKYRNSELEDFEFPIFSISDDVIFINKDQSRLKLSNKAIASTWNDEMMKKVYLQFAKNLDTFGSFQIFYVSGNVTKSNITEDYYLNTQLYINGIDMMKKNNNMSCLSLVDFNIDPTHDFETTSATYEAILKSREIDSILVPTTKEIDYIKERCNYRGYFFGCTNNVKEAIKLLNAGAVIIFTDDIEESNLQSEIVKAMNEYAIRKKGLQDEMITQEHFNNSIKNGEITSIDIINNNCNKLIELFFKLSKHSAIDVDTASDKQFVPFNKKMTLDDCQEQGIILLKNEGNILPIKHRSKVAIMGDSINQTSNALVKEKNILDYIKNYEEITPVGYAQGYMLNHPTDALLVNDAYNIGVAADISLVFLSVDSNGKVPTNQLTLLNTLKKNGVKICAVLNSPKTKDFSFIDYCDAALFSYFEANKNSKAILDVILGDINPSGKLVETVLLETRENVDEAVPNYSLDLLHKFPFGFGLSYTKFEYDNLEIKNDGVRFTIVNTGNYPGYAVTQMYIKNENTKHALRNKLLRGYNKVYLRKGEATKVFIPFDDETYKYFNVEKNLFGVESGTYNIYIGENYDEVKLEGTVTTEGYLYEANEFLSIKDEKYKQIEDPFNEFINTEERRASIGERLGFSKKKKVILIGSGGIFIDIICLFIVISYFIAKSGFAFDSFVIAMFALLIFVTLFSFIWILKTIKTKTIEVEDDTNDTLTEALLNISEFYEESKQVFSVYKKEENEEEIVKEINENPEYEEEVEEVQRQDEVERKYVANYESNSTSVAFKAFNSIEELANQFSQFTRTKGLSIEIESSRKLWAALVSTKLLFIDSNDKDLLKEMIGYLIEYLGSNTYIQDASNKWKKTKDTLWKKTRVEFLPSNFANSLNNAANNKEVLNVVALTNVRMENLFHYFNEFIENANNPENVVTIELSEQNKITLPKNIIYILVPEDPSYYDNLPYYVSNISFSINVILERVEKEEAKEFKHISYENLLEIISSSKDKFYLDENKWKTIDEFEDRVSQTDNFQIGNKATLQMEGFVATYLECGGDVNDIDDVLFLTKIVPMMKSTSLYKGDGGSNKLIQLIQDVFENESMTSAIKACNHIEMVTEFVVDESNSDENYEIAEEQMIDVIGEGEQVERLPEIEIENIDGLENAQDEQEDQENIIIHKRKEKLDSSTNLDENKEEINKEVPEQNKDEKVVENDASLTQEESNKDDKKDTSSEEPKESNSSKEEIKEETSNKEEEKSSKEEDSKTKEVKEEEKDNANKDESKQVEKEDDSNKKVDGE